MAVSDFSSLPPLPSSMIGTKPSMLSKTSLRVALVWRGTRLSMSGRCSYVASASRHAREPTTQPILMMCTRYLKAQLMQKTSMIHSCFYIDWMAGLRLSNSCSMERRGSSVGTKAPSMMWPGRPSPADPSIWLPAQPATDASSFGACKCSTFSQSNQISCLLSHKSDRCSVSAPNSASIRKQCLVATRCPQAAMLSQMVTPSNTIRKFCASNGTFWARASRQVLKMALSLSGSEPSTPLTLSKSQLSGPDDPAFSTLRTQVGVGS
mmetsp:Transcript_14857/g.18616  ORF Transcript_14857/g.18616 Transcript_14857/m.18616 type:complete len:265 (-) Transcript_14857:32-826(-)